MRGAAQPSHNGGLVERREFPLTWRHAATMALGIAADDVIRAVGHRDRALGVLSQRQAGDPEGGAFLLGAA